MDLAPPRLEMKESNVMLQRDTRAFRAGLIGLRATASSCAGRGIEFARIPLDLQSGNGRLTIRAVTLMSLATKGHLVLAVNIFFVLGLSSTFSVTLTVCSGKSIHLGLLMPAGVLGGRLYENMPMKVVCVRDGRV